MRIIGMLGAGVPLGRLGSWFGRGGEFDGRPESDDHFALGYPRTSQIRGTVTLQAIPGRSVAPGFTVRVSLNAAGPGPDPAVIGMGTCTVYKKLYTLNPAVNGLSNTTIARASLPKLLKTSHAVVVMPKLAYCGVIP